MEKKKVEEIIEAGLQGTDRYLVELNINAANEMEIFIDSDTVVDITHCVELSKYIESNLNREEEDYELNVSSAGLDMPLRLARQYRRHIGQLLIVKTSSGGELLFRITETDETGIWGISISKNPNAKKGSKNLFIESEPMHMNFNEITEAKIEIVF